MKIKSKNTIIEFVKDIEIEVEDFDYYAEDQYRDLTEFYKKGDRVVVEGRLKNYINKGKYLTLNFYNFGSEPIRHEGADEGMHYRVGFFPKKSFKIVKS